MRVSVLAFVAASLVGSLQVNAAERQTGIADALILEGERSSQLARELAPLKSARDVYIYNNATPKHLSPLSALQRTERDRFVQSLRFNDKGLTQFDYTLLQSLSPTEIYKVLALFGMQSGSGRIKAAPRTELDKDAAAPSLMMADFLTDYRCESRATCSFSVRMACTSNC